MFGFLRGGWWFLGGVAGFRFFLQVAAMLTAVAAVGSAQSVAWFGENGVAWVLSQWSAGLVLAWDGRGLEGVLGGLSSGRGFYVGVRPTAHHGVLVGGGTVVSWLGGRSGCYGMGMG